MSVVFSDKMDVLEVDIDTVIFFVILFIRVI